jgi:hypothetical protein
MNSEDQLLQKLVIAKKIMEKHNDINRGAVQESPTINTPSLQEFQPANGNYNIPSEFLGEEVKMTQQHTEIPTQDRIMGSRLPDEIKRLMIEHPIDKPNNMGGATLSNDLVEKASRLMNVNAKGDTVNENKKQITSNERPQGLLSADTIRDIVRETVEDVLKENGLLVESTRKSNDMFKFRVGNHIFEGKVTNVKKISK